MTVVDIVYIAIVVTVAMQRSRNYIIKSSLFTSNGKTMKSKKSSLYLTKIKKV